MEEEDSLKMWADRQQGFDQLVEAYRRLPSDLSPVDYEVVHTDAATAA